MKKFIIRGISLLLLAGIPFIATAQKLPKIQKVSLRAPPNVKIDGKLIEWNDRLQAYNNIDDIFYTISNDDDNLYLAIRQGQNKNNFDKMLLGGITFTISHFVESSKRENTENDISIRFPILIRSVALAILTKSEQYRPLRRKDKDSVVNKRKNDSLIYAANKSVADNFKEIEIKGVKEIVDPLISVYNTIGIKASGGFSNKMEYTYELSIPLKYLDLSVNNPAKFHYNIKINPPPAPRIAPGKKVGINEDAEEPEYLFNNSSTDFSGEYTLAKK